MNEPKENKTFAHKVGYTFGMVIVGFIVLIVCGLLFQAVKWAWGL